MTANVTSRSTPFHTRGAATPKTQSPIDFSLERRTTSLCHDADRRRLHQSSSTVHCKSFTTYSGALLLQQRNTRTARPNAIRSLSLCFLGAFCDIGYGYLLCSISLRLYVLCIVVVLVVLCCQ